MTLHLKTEVAEGGVVGRMISAILAPHRRPMLYHSLSFFSNRGLPFVAAFAAARILGADDFGVFVAAIIFFTALMMLVDIGLSLATMTLVARRAAGSPEEALITFFVAVAACLALGLLVGVLLVINADLAARWALNNPAMSAVMLAGAIYIPSSALTLVANGGLAGLQRYDIAATTGVLSGVVYLGAVVVGALVGGGVAAVWGAALGMLFRAIVMFVLLGPRLWRAAHCAKRSDFLKEARALLSVALPAMLASSAYAPVIAYLTGSLMRHSSGSAEAGAFGVSLQVFSLVSVLPSMITQFALPRLCSVTGQNARAARQRMVLKYAGVSLGIGTALSLPVAVAPGLVLRVLGVDFVAYTGTLQIMMIAAIVSAPEGVFSNYLLASGKYWLRAGSFYVWGGVVVCTMILFGDKAAHSAATAYASGYAFLVTLQGLSVFIHNGRSDTDGHCNAEARPSRCWPLRRWKWN